MRAADLNRGMFSLTSILFVAMAFTLPVPIYMLIAAGFLSYAGVIQMMALGLNQGLIGVIAALHAVFFGLVLLLASRSIARVLLGYQGRAGWTRLGAVLLLLFVVGCAPVFGYTGHEAYNGTSAYRLLIDIGRDFSAVK